MLLEAIKCLCKVFTYLHILKYVYHELWRPKIFHEFWGVSSAFVMADWKYFQGFIYNLILKEINPEYSLEALMLKLKLQYFGHQMQRTDSKDSDAGKDWRREEKGMTKDDMVGWHHGLNGHEIEQAPGIGDGQGSLVCCSPWGCKKLDMTEQLNWTELNCAYC